MFSAMVVAQWQKMMKVPLSSQLFEILTRPSSPKRAKDFAAAPKFPFPGTAGSTQHAAAGAILGVLFAVEDLLIEANESIVNRT